jgi:hypothetical protein
MQIEDVSKVLLHVLNPQNLLVDNFQVYMNEVISNIGPITCILESKVHGWT